MNSYKRKLFFTFLICIVLSFTLYSEGYAKTKKLTAKERREGRLVEKQKKKTIASLYKEAISYYRRLELDAAQQTFEQILALDPDQKKAKLYITKKIPPKRKLEARKKAKEAARAKRLAPKTAKQEARRQKVEKENKIKALYKEAMAYYRKDEITKSEQVFKQIIDLDPGQKKAKIWLTKKIPPKRKLEARKKAKEAARAKRLAPKTAKQEARRQKVEKENKIKALYKEAVSYYREDEITKSERAFKQIIDLDPGQEKAKIWLTKKIPPARKREVAKRAHEERKLKKIAEEEAQLKFAEVPLADATRQILDEKVREFLPKKEIEPALLRTRRIKPSISSLMTYTDNFYLVDEDSGSPEGELITSIRTGIEGNLGNLDYLLTGSYYANILLYDEHTEENRLDHDFGVRANLFRQSPIKVDLTESFKFTAEPPTSEETKLIDRFNNVFSSNIRYDMSPKTSFAFVYNQYLQHYIPGDYEDNSYMQHTLGPVVYWHLSPKTSLRGEYSLGVTNYYMGSNAELSSADHALTGGIEGNLTKKSSIYLKTGYQFRDYFDDSVAKDVSAYILSSMFEYKLTPKTTLEFIASSKLNESSYADAGYYRSWNLYGNCTYNLFNNLQLRGGIFYLRSDYPEVFDDSSWIERADNLFGATGRVSYTFRNMFSLYAEYEIRRRDSNIETYDYVNNRITGGVSLSF